MIVALADAAGLAVDDARLYEQIRRDAERFQRLLLPQLPDLVEPFEAAATYRAATTPGRVGGDWYDAQLVADQTCAAVIGDVLGHDLRAAAAMAQVRNMLRALLSARALRRALSSPSLTTRSRRSRTSPSPRRASPASNPPHRPAGGCGGAPRATRHRC